MRRNTDFESQHQNIPTLQSIEAQSEVSVDLRPNELEPLISKIFMLCLELERKDIIIDRLQSQAHLQDEMKRSQIDMASRDLHVRFDRLEQENRVLIESNVMLKNNAISMERMIADLEVHKQRAAYNKELEEKVYTLELRLKKCEQQKIEYLEREKNLKRENSMLSFSAIKTSQKNRIRDLQYELGQERSKLDNQKRLTADLKYQIEKNAIEVKNLKESQFLIRKSYEERIQKIEIMRAGEDLKQSQCTAANEEKIALLSQELNRLREQIDYQKGLLKEERDRVGDKDKHIKALSDEVKMLQGQVKSEQKAQEKGQEEGRRKEEEARQRQQQLLSRIQMGEQSIKTLKLSHSELEGYLKQKQGEEWEKSRELDRLRAEMEEREKEREVMMGELRKAKRKSMQSPPECELCKLRSATVIASSKSIGHGRPMNLEEIIEETERLNLSNKKIESLLNHHEMSVQLSQQSIMNSTQ